MSEFMYRVSPGLAGFIMDSAGREFETSRRFQAASAASHHPARRPMRGSGLGGVRDMFGCELAHARTVTVPIAIDVERRRKEALTRAPGSRLNGSNLMRSSVEELMLCAVRRQSVEQSCHAVDLGRLVGLDVRDHPEDRVVLNRSFVVHPLLNHRDRALVVLDHEGQEQAVELGAAGSVELRQLLVGQHAGPESRVLHGGHAGAV
jgi:hypothetical protein